jgi:hypothetical protein
MRAYIRIRNKQTGCIEDIDFPNIDEAFDAYWKLTDAPQDPYVEFELISEE